VIAFVDYKEDPFCWRNLAL